MQGGQLDNYVAHVEAENDRLRERVRQLEEQIGLSLDVPPIFSLTGTEARMLGLLMKRELVTKEFAIDSMYGGRPNDVPDPKIIDVYICKLRAKLNKYGIEITTIWGQGYALDGVSREKVKLYIDQFRKAA